MAPPALVTVAPAATEAPPVDLDEPALVSVDAAVAELPPTEMDEPEAEVVAWPVALLIPSRDVGVPTADVVAAPVADAVPEDRASPLALVVAATETLAVPALTAGSVSVVMVPADVSDSPAPLLSVVALPLAANGQDATRLAVRTAESSDLRSSASSPVVRSSDHARRPRTSPAHRYVAPKGESLTRISETVPV